MIRATLVFALVGTLWSGLAGASDLTFTERPAVAPQGSQTVPQTTPLSLKKADCALLSRYTTPPGVNYRPDQPGFDSQGRPIAPADLGGGTYPIDIPDQVVMYVGIDLAKRYGLNGLPPGVLNNQAIAGVVVWKDGQLFFNGKPLTPSDQNALVVACRKAGL